jgi:4'-phosphopantetheinyl transferase
MSLGPRDRQAARRYELVAGESGFGYREDIGLPFRQPEAREVSAMETWPLAPLSVLLPDDEVHVYAAPLPEGHTRSGLYDLLDDEERKRAGRFLHIPSREQYIAARGALRILLGRYLRCSPRQVRFTTSPLGKPELAPPAPPLHFNVSHSQGMALIAVTRIGQVGIDVEQVRTVETYLDMAQRFFTPGESSALLRAPREKSTEAFFHIWTRKEAFLKALGLGLTHGLERFEVSVPPDDPARILHIDGDRDAGARWSMQTLLPARGYIGALALETREHRLRCWCLAGQIESAR